MKSSTFLFLAFLYLCRRVICDEEKSFIIDMPLKSDNDGVYVLSSGANELEPAPPMRRTPSMKKILAAVGTIAVVTTLGGLGGAGVFQSKNVANPMPGMDMQVPPAIPDKTGDEKTLPIVPVPTQISDSGSKDPANKPKEAAPVSPPLGSPAAAPVSPPSTPKGEVHLIKPTYFFRESPLPDSRCAPVQSRFEEFADTAAACGQTYRNINKYGVAIANGKQFCGREIIVAFGGKQLTLTVVDQCPGCEVDNHLDMSLEAMHELFDGDAKKTCALDSITPNIEWWFK